MCSFDDNLLKYYHKDSSFFAGPFFSICLSLVFALTKHLVEHMLLTLQAHAYTATTLFSSHAPACEEHRQCLSTFEVEYGFIEIVDISNTHMDDTALDRGA